MPRTLPNKPEKVVESAGVPKEKEFKGAVHEVHLLDGSSSMNGIKFHNAVRGINGDIIGSRAAAMSTGINGTVSVYQFASGLDMRNRYCFDRISILQDFAYPDNQMGGSTDLYNSITKVISVWLAAKKPEDKVLLKIFTDGDDTTNASLGRIKSLALLIKDVQEKHGFTVTFVGTKEDVKKVSNRLNIDESNTLVHDNTGEGVADAFMYMKTASASYRSNLSKGMDVSMNFYAKSTD